MPAQVDELTSRVVVQYTKSTCTDLQLKFQEGTRVHSPKRNINGSYIILIVNTEWTVSTVSRYRIYKKFSIQIHVFSTSMVKTRTKYLTLG